jgi:acid phosphatase (class A)
VQFLSSKPHSCCPRAYLLPLCLLLAGLATPAVAGHHYLSNTNIALQLLPPPPAPGSAEQSFDLAEVESVHRAINPSQAALARSENHVFAFTFTPVIGSFFQTNRFPRTEALFNQVLKETDQVLDAGKDFWMRPRPFLIDTNLLDGTVEKLSWSYPSGHSTRGTVFALFLSELFPERSDAILAKGREIGWHRVMLAKHYPTDIYAGRVLGQYIVRQMKTSHAFRHDFKQAKEELESWMKIHGAGIPHSMASGGS